MDRLNFEDVYELSPYQAAALSRAHKGEGIFHEQLFFSFTGNIDIECFKKTWAQIVQRHAILRTTFHHNGLKRPVQVVHYTGEMPIDVWDWSKIPQDEQDKKMQAHIQQDRLNTFDLQKAPQMRMALIKYNQHQVKFWWRFHHILMDGWSFAVVLDDYFKLYRAHYLNKKPIDLAPVYPFREYITYLKNRNTDRERTYWENRLKNFLPPKPLTLNGSKKNKGGTGARQDRLDLLFTKELSTAIYSVIKEKKITLNAVIQGIWRLMMSRYYNTDDIVIGAVSGDRPQALKNADYRVGLYVNTLPIRFKVEPEAQFVDWITRLQTSMLEDFLYSSSSEDEIKKWGHIDSPHRLFDVVVIYENMPTPELDFDNLDYELEDMWLESRPHFPLSYLIFPDKIIKTKVIYDVHRFNADNAHFFLHNVQKGVEQFVAATDARVGDIFK